MRVRLSRSLLLERIWEYTWQLKKWMAVPADAGQQKRDHGKRILGGTCMREVDYKKMGMRIRRRRREKGWTQGELAKMCGVSMSFIGHIERGSRIMSMDTFIKLCDVLDVSADGLLWDTVKVSDCNMQRMLDTAESGSPKNYGLYVQIMESVAEVMSRT